MQNHLGQVGWFVLDGGLADGNRTRRLAVAGT